ncbi:hypothetical protein FA15DRAFT_579916 [Coprinopsis marcescibilis]|uniref:Transmembrane protein n=1 Tax=Coprinopsis marcescibilis TaxID=230819 RepID=A0A5C3LCP3_COPMA|nr:hypothetical protein FA15DRAFT_579916 [Coprinopsis marcescibilis]
MISLPKDVESQLQPHPDETHALLEAGSSNVGQLLSDAPPTFSTYEATYFEVGNGDICSHDPHLNSDGEALYRFLLEQSNRRPFTRANLRGTHTETRTRWVSHTDSNGRTRQKSETYTETVTDFDFCVDIFPPSELEHVQWSVPDTEPTYRGKMVRELEDTPSPSLAGIRREKRKATRKENRLSRKWNAERYATGLAPWTPREALHSYQVLARVEVTPLQSSKTLRRWADEYCASPKCLKEFEYDLKITSWEMSRVEHALRAMVMAAPYDGDINITFTKHRSKIYIRPNNTLSELLSNGWIKFLAIILFIYPFIWLFKRFHSRGGGKWKVCGAAYPMKKWVPVDGTESLPIDEEGSPSGSDLPPYSPFADDTPAPPPQTTKPHPYPGAGTPSEPIVNSLSASDANEKKLLGIPEMQWLRTWNAPITRAVVTKHRSSTPLLHPDSAFVDAFFN